MRVSALSLMCMMRLQMLVDLGQDVYREELEQAFLREASAFYKVSLPFFSSPSLVVATSPSIVEMESRAVLRLKCRMWCVKTVLVPLIFLAVIAADARSLSGRITIGTS